MILEKLNLQHEHSLSHKNSLPGSNPLIPLGPCALHSQSLSLLLCLSNPFFSGSPPEATKASKGEPAIDGRMRKTGFQQTKGVYIAKINEIGTFW